jgi:putative glutamine amidotransferase
MAADPTPSVRIGVFGPEESNTYDFRGCALWAPGYQAALTAAGAAPVLLPNSGDFCEDSLENLHGLVFVGDPALSARQLAEAERVCEWCRARDLPLLAVDNGLLVLNLVHGGTVYNDLPRELPDALQHRHPPEKGLRHAINVLRGTRLAGFYGDGEIVVNSEHRRAIDRLARGFTVSARALDGVIEAVETDGDDWFAVGVQWRPASASASGLDIQLFRGLIDACVERLQPAQHQLAA